MTSLLLQITTTVADTTATLAGGAEAAQEPVRLIDLAMAGGWAMIPLAVLSLAAIYIFVERFLTLKKAAKNPDGFNDTDVTATFTLNEYALTVAGCFVLCLVIAAYSYLTGA